MRRFILLAAVILLSAPALANADPIPAAVTADPPQDKNFPAGLVPFALPTHGVNVNAVLFTANGRGPHPTVLLLHGLPGNEQNLDLARAIQRDGWNVLTLHYRGSWGSAGQFTFAHCLEDAQAAMLWLRNADKALAPHIDSTRIVIVGHSFGGFVAGYTAAHDPKIMGTALISASSIIATFTTLPYDKAVKIVEDNVQNRAGMRTVGDATAQALAEEAIRNGPKWNLPQFAPALAKHPLLIVTSEDGNGPTDEKLAKAVESVPGSHVTGVHFATDHSYNDQRIGLESAVIDWLERLQGAPKRP
jgi:pimeloyl-ACP methyl ester carboxylesterase